MYFPLVHVHQNSLQVQMYYIQNVTVKKLDCCQNRTHIYKPKSSHCLQQKVLLLFNQLVKN